MRRRKVVGWGLAAVAVLAVAALAFLAWALTPLGPEPEALDAMVPGDGIMVVEDDTGISFWPEGDDPRVGVILYPGGRVDYRSYAPLARRIADKGYRVTIVPVALNLAVLSPDRADEVIDANPDILVWCVGGHSLGGAMAAQFAKENPENVQALALLAAYPPGSADLSDRELPVVSLFGTLDGVLDKETFEQSPELLPEGAVFTALEGGNHAQFGSYGPQPGDYEATIPLDMQQEQTAQAIALMLRPLRFKVQ